MTNVKKIYRTFVHLAIFALCVICTVSLFSCNNTNSLHNFIDDVRPSSHFSTVDFHLSGDTISYYRIRLPQK